MKTLDNKAVYVVMTGAKKCSIIPELVKEFISEGANTYTFLTDIARKIAVMKDFEIPGNMVSLDSKQNYHPVNGYGQHCGCHRCGMRQISRCNTDKDGNASLCKKPDTAI